MERPVRGRSGHHQINPMRGALWVALGVIVGIAWLLFALQAIRRHHDDQTLFVKDGERLLLHAPTATTFNQSTIDCYGHPSSNEMQPSSISTLASQDGSHSSKGGCKLSNPAFHDQALFERDLKEMVSNFKVFIYPHSSHDPFRNIFLPVESKPLGNYASESYFKKALGGSSFVTKNASEARLFFLPFSIVHLRYDQRVGTKGLETFIKTYIANISREWPYWNRTGGADHFFVSCHSITRTVVEKVRELQLNVIQVVCSANTFRFGYVPHKDISLPQVWPRKDVHHEAQLVAKREKLAFFAGAVNSEVRVAVLKAWSNDTEIVAHSGRIPTSYAEALLTSKFCLHVKGFEVNTARLADALYYGCVPVIIANDYDLPFKDVLDWNQFSIVVSPQDIPSLKKILLDLLPQRYATLHQNVLSVRKHFQWHSTPKKYDAFYMVMYELWLRRHVLRSQL